MPPIPTYQNAPLHPDGVTPKTTAAEQQSGSQPASNPVPEPTRTVAQEIDNSAPPPPQPGARPVPGPGPTSTNQPPSPMPGANPNYAPPSVTATITATTTSTVPPPSQLNIPPPLSNLTPSKSTSSVPPPPQVVRSRSPTRINFGAVPSSPLVNNSTDDERRSIEHPPGYVQNPYAADGTAAERARLEAAMSNEQSESILGSLKTAASEVGKYAQKVEKDAWEWIGRKGAN